MSETVFLWLFCFSVSAGFILIYGIIEEVIRQWRPRMKLERQVMSESPRPAISKAGKYAVEKPILRGYDSRDLYWSDSILRIRDLEREVTEYLKEKEKPKKDA